jgi:hypothetical protein
VRPIAGARFRDCARAPLFGAVVLFALMAVFSAGIARADTLPTLDGRWTASSLTVRWIIGEWGDACGPRPSGGGEGGGAVTIDQSGGELQITGLGRAYTTAQCWELYPGLQRVGHSASARAWKSTCKTAPNDPRQAALTTSLTASDDTISFYEGGQYQFIIQGQNCTASVGRYRTYAIAQRAEVPGAAPSAIPSAAPPPPKKTDATVNRCASPGPAARLDVRPARKLMRAGESFTFRALVSDASGCPLVAPTSWAIDSGGENAEITSPATIQVKPNAPEGEVRLTASVGGRSAVVTIEIASSARYDKLLESGAFNAEGEVDETASVAIASQSIGAASAVAEDRASGRKWIFVGVVAVVALVLAIASVILFGQNRKLAARRAADDAARRVAARSRTEVAVPAVAPPPPEPEPKAPSPPQKRTICPICGRQYGAEERFCGDDGATLLPLNV